MSEKTDAQIVRVDAITLLRGGVAIAAEHGRRLLPLVLGYAVVAFVIDFVFVFGNAASLAYAVGSPALDALVTAFAIRIMVAPRSQWWRPDSALVGYLGISLLVSLPLLLLLLVSGGFTPLLLVAILLIPATVVLTITLNLWMTAILLGMRLGLREAWRRMEGACLGYVGSLFLTFLLIGAGVYLTVTLDPEGVSPVATGVGVIVSVFTTIIDAGVLAYLWRTRGPTAAPS